MKRLFRIYWPFARGVMQSYAAYGLNFAMYLLGDLFQTVVLLYIWFAVFQSSEGAAVGTIVVINGFTFDSMIGYVVISTITGILISNEVHWEIGQDVRSGNIAMNLIKPVSYQLRQYFGALGTLMVNTLFIGMPMVVIYLIFRGITGGPLPSLFMVLSYLVSVGLSSLILFLINYLFGLAAFYVEYIFGFIFAKEALLKLLSGQLIPIAFFPEVIRGFFVFLPFAGLVYTPTMAFLGMYQGQELALHMLVQLVWVLLLWLLTQVVWRAAIRRVTIMGG